MQQHFCAYPRKANSQSPGAHPRRAHHALSALHMRLKTQSTCAQHDAPLTTLLVHCSQRHLVFYLRRRHRHAPFSISTPSKSTPNRRSRTPYCRHRLGLRSTPRSLLLYDRTGQPAELAARARMGGEMRVWVWRGGRFREGGAENTEGGRRDSPGAPGQATIVGTGSLLQ
jgi:hypothetical protein